MSAPSFSFNELESANPVPLPAPQMITASDGVPLSYRRYVPAAPRAAVLFYHGGGAHSGAGYPFLANGLQSKFNAVVYTPDIRGHGDSGGPRGDAPSPKQVWQDVTTLIKHVRAEHPQLPLFLGGHSSGAGLVLNYTSVPNHEPVDSYIFLSPEFGFRSKTARPNLASPFAKVNTGAFILNAMSGGILSGHTHAVRFSYPPEILAADKGMVASNTVNMANAITPSAPHQQVARLDRAFGLWIGADDELLLPSMVIAFADLATAVRAKSEASIIPNAKHLSVLIRAFETIGPWITKQV